MERDDVAEEAVMASMLAVSYLLRLMGRMKSPAGLFHVHDLVVSAALSEGFSQKGGQPNSSSGRVLWLVPRPVVGRNRRGLQGHAPGTALQRVLSRPLESACFRLQDFLLSKIGCEAAN